MRLPARFSLNRTGDTAPAAIRLYAPPGA